MADPDSKDFHVEGSADPYGGLLHTDTSYEVILRPVRSLTRTDAH